MKQPFWKMIFPRDVRRVDGRGSEARQEAEKGLTRVRQELVQTKSQTPYYEGLGRELRLARERNHIAEKLRASLREAHP